VQQAASPRVGVRAPLEGGSGAAEDRHGVPAARVAEATVGEVAEQEAEQKRQRDRATAARKARQGAGGISLLANTEAGVDRATPLQRQLGT
jgi:hypothetical protein